MDILLAMVVVLLTILVVFFSLFVGYGIGLRQNPRDTEDDT